MLVCLSVFQRSLRVLPKAAARAPGVPGVPTRALAADDGGQASGSVAVGSVQRSRGPQGAQVAVRAPQGSR